MKPFLSAGAASLVALLGLAACSKLDSGQNNEMGWARAALERNDRIEVVAADSKAGTFTVRVKDTGELHVVRVDQLVATPPGAATASQAGTAATAATPNAAPPVASSDTPPAPAAAAAGAAAESADNGAPASPGEAARAAAATPTNSRVVSADEAGGPKPPRSENASGASPGRVLASGPGYTIKAADSKGATIKRLGAGGAVATGTVERMHEPIICQGTDRFLQIDNRNLEFDGDALSAEDGCELHITNSRIFAKGVGVQARKANVHIENSDIEGVAGSVAASDGAQVYSASSTFKGLRRREDTAAFHDLGGNAWN